MQRVFQHRYGSHVQPAMIETLERRQLLCAVPGGTSAVAAATIAPAALTASQHVVVPATTKAATAATFAATLSKVSPVSILEGNHGSTVLTLTNKGTSTAAGTLSITLAASTDGTTPASGAPLLTMTKDVQLKAKRTAHIKLPFTVPDTLAAGDYSALATVQFTATDTSTPPTSTLNVATKGTFVVKQPPQAVVTPSLVSHYTGTVKAKSGGIFGSIVDSIVGKQDFDLKITSQTTDSLTGTITVAGHSATGTLTGRELSNGNFHYTLDSDGYNVTLDGHVATDGNKISGDITGTLSGQSVIKVKGTFQATRQSS